MTRGKKSTAKFRDLNDASERDIQTQAVRQLLSMQSAQAQIDLDQDMLRDVELKRMILSQKERAAAKHVKSIFISYTGKGSAYFQVARALFEEVGFEVYHGFDNVVEGGENLSGSIISRIRSSAVFLGIWTVDFDASSIAGTDGRGQRVPAENGGIPGVWMPVELGVAVAERKPFKILFEEGMHRQYIEKPFGSRPHVSFRPPIADAGSFREKCLVARDTLNSWYERVVETVEHRSGNPGSVT